MAGSIRCLHMNHLNVVLERFDASVEHVRGLFGAQFVFDLPRPEWHAGLVVIGGVLFELFVPHEYLLNARYGPHYVGIEYQVPSVDDVRDTVLGRGIRIVRDIGIALHTHPADCFGVGLEFNHRNFHSEPNPSWLEPMHPVGYWRDEHPLGLTGLARYSVAVSDLDAAVAFFQDLLGAAASYEADRPAVAGRAVGLMLADSVVEIMAPVGDGPLRHHVDRYGDGIRAAVFSVRNLDQARRYFVERGITLHEGDAPDSLAIAPEDNLGVRFELSR